MSDIQKTPTIPTLSHSLSSPNILIVKCVEKHSTPITHLPIFDEIDGFKLKGFKIKIHTPLLSAGLGYKKDGKERNVNIEANFAGFGSELEVDLEKFDKTTVSSSKNYHPRPKLMRQCRVY
ncbi:hypothetical protein [Vibrio cholerae]|uniref:hypothetical protein n=1 Tax=Vibrio cholerae TaxID=666 RepID=UPI0020C757B9|nr:hypothetical protein [Vibrio cholerae]